MLLDLHVQQSSGCLAKELLSSSVEIVLIQCALVQDLRIQQDQWTQGSVRAGGLVSSLIVTSQHWYMMP